MSESVRGSVYQFPSCNFLAATLKLWLSHIRLVHSNDLGSLYAVALMAAKRTTESFIRSALTYVYHKERITQV